MVHEATIAFPAEVWDEIAGALHRDVESAGVLLAGVAETVTGPILTVNRVEWVPDDSYLVRQARQLEIESSGWMPALRAAACEGLHPFFFHTHPGADPRPSVHDARVDAAIGASFRTRTGVSRYASFILGGTSERPAFTGRVLSTDDDPAPIARARIVGDRIRVLTAFDSPGAAAESAVHERQVRALGKDGQRILADLRVGVVGAGGTGSSVIEQLVRLGVRNLVVVDDDDISPTNVSRVYGSSADDDGRPKVHVAAANAARIGLETDLHGVHGRITRREPLELLRDRDVIFGCTDDHTGRLNLCRLAVHYLIPIVDMGVAIDAPGESIRSISARLSYVAPGGPCLVCSRDIDLNRVRDESYSPEERERLAGEDYAVGLGEPDPSVVAYTTLIAAWAIADVLERLFGFGEDQPASGMLIRIADRKITTRRRSANPEHFCADRSSWGRGDQEHFLGVRVWPA